MSPGVLTLTPVVKVNGTPLAAEWIDAMVALRVDRSLGVIGRATLRFDDAGFARSASNVFSLGASVDVLQHGGAQLFKGTVTGVGLEQVVGEHPQLVATVDDASYKLTLGTKVQTLLKVKYSDAVKKVIGAAGIGCSVDADSGPVHDYLLQAGSALSFVNNVALRTGCVWWVDDDTLNFKKAGTSEGTVDIGLYEELIEFSVRASGLRPTAVKVSGWDIANQQTIVGSASTASTWTHQPEIVSNYLKPTTRLGAASTATPDTTPNSQDEAQMTATALYGDWLAGSVVARGTCSVNAGIKPMTTVRVTDAGPASGSYLVSEVQHVYTPNGFTTRFVAGPNRPTGLVDTLGRPAPDPSFTVTGLVVATVTDNKDPNNVGRVKVRYNGIGDQVESTWARLITTSGGKDRGVVFLPEVNDEVLVGFEHNDSRRPVVLGALFSQKNSLPQASELLGGGGTVDYRRITSRKGHKIELADGDQPAQQHIKLQLGTTAHVLRLGADEVTLDVVDGKPFTLKVGQAKLSITGSGDVTIEGVNITIKAQAKVDVQAQAQLQLKSAAQLTVQGGILQVKADGVGNVEAGGPLSLKGAMVAIN